MRVQRSTVSRRTSLLYPFCATSVRTQQVQRYTSAPSWYFMKRKRMEGQSPMQNYIPPHQRDTKAQARVNEGPAQPRQQRQSPNYFLAVRIRNEAAVARIVEMQKYISENHRHVGRFLIPTPKLHITLFVLSLYSHEEVANAQALLKTFFNSSSTPQETNVQPNTKEEQLNTLNDNFMIRLKGMSEFSSGSFVLWAAVHDEYLARLTLLAERMFDHFKSGMAENLERKLRFTPHITMLKFRGKGRRRDEALKGFSLRACPEQFLTEDVGEQLVDCVELLAMQEGVEPNGEYPCFGKVYTDGKCEFLDRVPRNLRPTPATTTTTTTATSVTIVEGENTAIIRETSEVTIVEEKT